MTALAKPAPDPPPRSGVENTTANPVSLILAYARVVYALLFARPRMRWLVGATLAALLAGNAALAADAPELALPPNADASLHVFNGWYWSGAPDWFTLEVR